ncbi:hypothetical protein G4B88_008873 [Cannabis sativa]|uniref:Uncharacterized protein n=1 Tax=Cannabis sativa TaxID=3483 RepID=A0A7J6HP34_CANSA|nr:hypothetical protein G4B88_008873 [Cannabis sativa]
MMDLTGSRDDGVRVDLELGVLTSDEEFNKTPVSGSKQQAKKLIAKFCGGFVDGLIKAEDGVSRGNVNGVSLESVKVTDKMLDGEDTNGLAEKTSSVKEKPPKPPRPPRGPSLDAADQKLIREISELAILKRARAERIKAAKSSLTTLFFLVILFHDKSSRSSTESLQGP